jgi:hypothetical protein
VVGTIAALGLLFAGAMVWTFLFFLLPELSWSAGMSTVQRAVFGNTSDVAPDLTVIDMLTPKGSGTDVWHADSTFMPAHGGAEATEAAHV